MEITGIRRGRVRQDEAHPIAHMKTTLMLPLKDEQATIIQYVALPLPRPQVTVS